MFDDPNLESSVTESIEGPQPASPATRPPTSLLVASTLVWLVGILTCLITTAIGIPAMQGAGVPALPLVSSLVLGLMLCVAGFQLRRRRRLGVYFVLLALLVVGLGRIVLHTPGSAGFGLALVVLLLGLLNWKELR
jgi:hypothetical protein